METDFFDMVKGVLQWDIQLPYQSKIDQDYVLRMLIYSMKENGFTQEKARSRRYTAQSITDEDYTDDQALLANTPTHTES